MNFLFAPGLGGYWIHALGLYLVILLERAAGGQNGSPELDHPFHYIFSRFQNQKLLASCQGYDGIRRNFDMFNQVGVDNKRYVVQPRELYHELLQSVGSQVYRRRCIKRLRYARTYCIPFSKQ
jgi:hypothetical protein